MSSQKKEKAASSVGFWEDLGQKGIEGNPKVAIVPFLHLFLEFQSFVIF